MPIKVLVSPSPICVESFVWFVCFIEASKSYGRLSSKSLASSISEVKLIDLWSDILASNIIFCLFSEVKLKDSWSDGLWNKKLLFEVLCQHGSVFNFVFPCLLKCTFRSRHILLSSQWFGALISYVNRLKSPSTRALIDLYLYLFGISLSLHQSFDLCTLACSSFHLRTAKNRILLRSRQKPYMFQTLWMKHQLNYRYLLGIFRKQYWIFN